LQHAPQAPESLREQLAANADGIPYYIEELIKMQIDDGVIHADGLPWQVDLARLQGIRVPATLTALLQARLDRLTPDERLVLQCAAVVGRVFWDRAVFFLTAHQVHDLGDIQSKVALEALQCQEMIVLQPASSFADAMEFSFKNALLHEVAYQSVLKRLRRVDHGLAAQWLLEQSGERRAEYAGVIADHLELAGETESAAQFWRQAAEHSAAIYANPEAVRAYSRALALSPAEPTEERWRLLLGREHIYHRLGQRPAQTNDLIALEALAEALAAPAYQSEAALRRANYANAIGDYAAALQAAQRAEQLGAVTGDPWLQAAGCLEGGQAFYRLGRYLEACQQFERGLSLAGERSDLAIELFRWAGIATLYQGDQNRAWRYFNQALERLRQLNQPQITGNVYHSMGTAYQERGDFPQAQHFCEQALAAYRQVGDRRGEAQSLQDLGLALDKQGLFAQALACFQQAEVIYRDIGDRLGQGWVLNNIGSIHQARGELSAALGYFNRALEIYLQIGLGWGEAISRHNLGVALLTCGDYAAARPALQRALEICQRVKDRWGEIWRLAYLGLLENQTGHPDLALQYCEQAWQIAQEVQARNEQALALTHLGHARLALQQFDGAHQAYQEAALIRRELGQPSLTVEVLAGLARLHLAQGNLASAATYVDEIGAYLQRGGSLDGADEPLRIYLTCYQVLKAQDDPAAAELLGAACNLLQVRAARIGDAALQRSFLENVPYHQTLLQLQPGAC
jgi:tetratricopeptide (TPR) repeat protein